MKKLALVLVVLGSGVTACGFSGWKAVSQTEYMRGLDIPGWSLSAGWSTANQFLITVAPNLTTTAR